MTSNREHFKEPLEKLDCIIGKLQTNLGVSEDPHCTSTATKEVVSQHKSTESKKTEQPKEAQTVGEVKSSNTTTHTEQTKTGAASTQTKKEGVEKGGKAKNADKEKEHKPKEEKPKQQKPKQPTTVVVEKEPKGEAKKQGKEQELVGTVDDFCQLDIRIGQIKECWKHPSSDNLYCEKINIGDEVREIASGLQKYVPIDQMSGPVLVFTNLKARKLADFMSNGMVMANSDKDRSDIKLVIPKGKIGERVVLEGSEQKFTQDKLPVLNPKKKILEKCINQFTTDNEGHALWNGQKLKTSEGYIMCPIKDGLLS